jgi:hypothetical protein
MSAILALEKMPKSCSACKFCYSRKDILGQKVLLCLIKNPSIQNVTKYIQQRHPQCPLQDTTELLEALEEIGNYFSFRSITPFKDKMPEQYTKLYKALGGNDE